MFRRKSKFKASAEERVNASKALFRQRIESVKTGKGKNRTVKPGLERIGTGYFNDVHAVNSRVVVKTSRNDTPFGQIRHNFFPDSAKHPGFCHKRAREAGLPVPKYYFTQARFGKYGMEHFSVHERVKPNTSLTDSIKALPQIMKIVKKASKNGLVIDVIPENFGVKKTRFNRDRVVLLDTEPIHSAKTISKKALITGHLKRLHDYVVGLSYTSKDKQARLRAITEKEFKKAVIRSLGRRAWKEFENPSSQEWRKVKNLFSS